MRLRLSQGQLNLLTTCPRQFQHLYLDQLGTPIHPDRQERLNWGHQFHLLMQQRELGLTIAPPEPHGDPNNQPLYQCLENLRQAAPDLFRSGPGIVRQSEHRRTLEVQGYLLTVVYDLLILEGATAEILDWKTYPRPQSQRWLAEDWQTRLYPYVLVETSDYAPEQVAMTYWFVQNPSAAPSHWRFTGHQTRHQQTHQDLTQLLDQLSHWLDRYQAGEALPQVPLSSPHCDRCPFAVRCQRGPQAPWAIEPPLPEWEAIEEVRL